MKTIVWADEVNKGSIPQVGGKGANLGEMMGVGLPVSGKINLDSILSIVQMPPGVPVAGVGLDNGKNAGLLAAQILALEDKRIEKKLIEYREEMKEKIVEDSKEFD